MSGKGKFSNVHCRGRKLAQMDDVDRGTRDTSIRLPKPVREKKKGTKAQLSQSVSC